MAIPLILFFIKYHPAYVEMDWLQEPAELWNGNSVANDEKVTSWSKGAFPPSCGCGTKSTGTGRFLGTPAIMLYLIFFPCRSQSNRWICSSSPKKNWLLMRSLWWGKTKTPTLSTTWTGMSVFEGLIKGHWKTLSCQWLKGSRTLHCLKHRGSVGSLAVSLQNEKKQVSEPVLVGCLGSLQRCWQVRSCQDCIFHLSRLPNLMQQTSCLFPSCY